MLGGYAIAVVLHRRQRQLPVEHLAARAAAAGVLAGAALGLLCWLSAGSVGDQALAGLGPVGWQVGLVAALEMGLVASLNSTNCPCTGNCKVRFSTIAATYMNMYQKPQHVHYKPQNK